MLVVVWLCVALAYFTGIGDLPVAIGFAWGVTLATVASYLTRKGGE